MIKSRFTNILSTVVCCILFITLAHFNAKAAPPGANCHCVITIVAQSSCNGANSGTATATAYDGTAPYTYRWSNGQTGATATGLATGTYTVTSTDKYGCTASQSVAISSVSLSVSAGSDKTICKGSSTQLSASGATMYSWTPTTGLSNASIANPVASPTVTTTYTVTGVVSSGELVTNGNFESGNTGFSSAYAYNSDLYPEGRYYVGSNANNYHGNFFGTGRGGSGKFMIINGATVAGVEVWSQTINVSPNTTYYFSTWITALNNLVSANLAFKVNGVLMGPVISSPSSPNSWVQFYAVWNSGSATSADISIVNQNTIANGNDFGLDDISFTSVCSKTDQVKVTVNSATADAGPDQTVCTGQSATLTATGGGTYAWSTGATTASITVNPSTTTTYTVTVTNNGCTATDQVNVTRVTSNLSASIAKTDAGCKADTTTICTLTLATSQHGLWLDDIPSAPSKYYKISSSGVTATRYSDGRMQITGTFENVSDANRKWTLDVMYTNKMNWTEFSAQGGTWKGQASNVGTNYLNWDYYIMDATYANKLTGSGTYVGKVLNLTHMPSNYLYGFQVGQGANDQTADWGMSGWFEHTGSWTGNGDLNFDAVCNNTQVTQTTSCNGTADLSISGGTAPITYAWSNGRTSQDVSGLCAGSYTVTITDGNGCSITKSVTIGTTSNLSASIAKTDAGCKADTTTICTLTLATSQHGLWLNSIPNDPSKYYKISSGGVTATRYSDGRMKITGTFQNVSDANRKWTLDVMYTNKMNWTEFSAQGGTWKGQAGNVGTNYLNWDYYIMDVTYANKLTGSGTYAGKTLNLTHMPSNYLYGFQVGQGANDQTADWGMSGWFEHTGSWTGNGDLNFDAVCDSTLITQTTSCNGTADLTVSGGATPYTYGWSNGRTSQDLSGLCAGTYTVTITDANGCTTTKSVTIGTTANLSITGSITNPGCTGSTGSIDVTVSGGKSPYTYKWSNNATTEDLANIGVGTYTVTVTDANGCTGTYTGSIVVVPTLSVTATVVSPNCYGGTGSIDASPAGGSTPYTYKWSNNATTQDLNNIPAGTYTLTVTDARGCTATVSKTITQPADLISSISKTDVSCGSGNIPCQLFQYAAGSHAVYLPTLGYSTNNWVFGAQGGTIETYANGTARIYGNIYLQSDTTKSFFLDFNFSNKMNWTQWSALGRTWKGDANIVGTNYQNWTYYIFSQTTPSTLTGRNSLVGNNMSIAHYPANFGMGLQIGLAANDKNGNYGLSTWFTYSGWKSGQGDINANLQCVQGQCNGTTTLTVSGGTSPYTYSWNTGATTQNLSGLCPGTYTVTITDSKGCKDTLTATIVGGNDLVVDATGTNIACAGVCNGTATVTASGGSTPYTYLWSNGATTQSLSGICAGTYIVTVTDNKGCFGKDTVVITANPKPEITATPTHVNCFGASTGGVTTTVSGGTTPYTYSWTPGGATTANLTGKPAGTYTVILTDANGCKDTASATITQPSSAVDATVSSTPVSCIGGNDGTATVVASGGTSPYTYSWSNSRTTAAITGLNVGTYTVTVTDAKGCTVTKTVQVTGKPPLTIGAVPSPVLCNGGSTGSINATISGGTPGYTFLWSNGAVTEDISGVAAGTYTLTVTDSKGCVATASVTVQQPQPIVATATPVNIACFGGNTGGVNVSVVGGTTPYTYIWSNGAVTRDISGLTAGTYTVTVTDANGCKDIKSATITQQTALQVTATPTPVSCYGLNNGSITTAVNGGVAPYTYNWGGGITTANRSNLAPGTYSVTVTDANNCTGTASATITQPADSLNGTTSSTPVSCIGGTDGTASVIASGGTAPYTYAWNTTPIRNTATITGLRVGSYTVTITDAKGCTIVRTVQVTGVPPLTVGSVPSPVLCKGGSTGSINVTISGGTPGYTFQWSNGATTEDISGLTAGTYNVTVTDANGCVATAGVTVTEPQQLVATATPQNIACFGGNTGGVTLSVVGGTTPFTYIWSNGALTRDITGVVAGTYSVTVTDKNGCTATASATVTQQAALQVTANKTDVTCFGLNNGSITTSVNGGVAPYTYNWGGGITTANRSNLAPGTYNVTVTDANGCTGTASATITQPNAALAASIVKTDVKCFGDATGAADLTVTGGTAPYTYAWNGGATTEDRTGLVAGTYTVTVTDAKGCTTTATTTITQPNAALNATAVKTDVNCFGGSNGTVTLTVTGGTAAYSFVWSNGAITQNLTGLTAGTYTVTVTDAKGCTATASATVTQPSAALAATAAKTDVNCFGGNNGTITLTVTGGTTAYTFNWGGGVTTQNRTGLAVGTYTVTVTDAKGCTATASATITQPTDSLNGTTSSTPVSCIGGTDGTASVVASGGTAPYTYAWNTTPIRNTATITGLRVGSYTLTITDAKGCAIVRTVQVTGVPPLTLGSVPSPVLCNGGSTGSINLTVSGGTPSYTFQWSNGAVTEDISNLAAGTYSVTVTDHNGCVATASVSVTQPQPLVATATPVNIACNGAATGGVNLSVVGGTSPFTYLWSNGTLTRDLTGLTAGTYSVTVTDKNGCTANASATVTQQAALQVTANKTDVTCFGLNNGSITTTVNGGVAPYTYNWGGGITTANRTNLTPGTYSVTVTDANNCTGTASATITQPADSLNSTTSSTPVSCIGGTDGTASVVASGGTAPYTYAWNTTPIRNTATITGLRVGSYTVTITDAKGCTIVRTVQVTGVPPLTVGAVPSPVLCNGGTTGSINATVSGGTPGYTFLWSNGAVTEDISGVAAGNYTLTVTDSKGCVATASVTVNQPQPLQATATPQHIACFGGNTGGVTLSVVGGTTPFTYAWSNGAVAQNLTGLAAGTYTVTVTDKNGCTATASATVTQQPALQVNVVGTNLGCFQNSSGSATANVTGGVAPYTYVWNTTPVRNTQTITSLGIGTYTVTVTDANGCTGTGSTTITQPDSLEALTSCNALACYGDTTANIVLLVVGGTTPYTYLWSTGATTRDLPNRGAGTYTVTVTDAKGCTITASAIVEQPALLVATATPLHIACNGAATGGVNLTVTGGTAPFTFAWSNGANTQNLTGLTAGTYSVTVTDSKGCKATASVTINQQSALQVTATPTSIPCFGQNNGSITTSVNGGVAPYTYNWGGGITTANRSNLAPGTYSVTVTDANNCTGTASATITQPADSLNGTTSSTPVSCIGGTDGTASVVASGGTAPYTYAWNTTPIRNTATITGLRVGSYTVTITDAKGCNIVRTVQVTGVPPLTVGSVPSPVLCNGGSTGSINLTISGGTPGYTFRWSNGATTQNITGLAAGTYNVTVTDANGCVATAGVTVQQPQPLVATATPQHIACFGANNGGVNLSVTGGTTPFTYIWSNGALTRDITGVVAGTYSVTVTDKNGCTATASATVNQQSALQVTANKTDVTCFGLNNGGITTAVNGGVAPYTYNWGAGQPTTANRSNLAPGTYSVTVTDANGCTGTASATITQPSAALSATIAKTDVKCFGDQTGAADLTVTGGTAPYVFAWSNQASTEDLTGLTAGTYTITVTDAKGCTTTATTTITQPNAALNATAVKTDVNCFGGSNGSVTLTVTGGTAAYSFVWSNGAITQNLTGLTAGTYTVTVTDAKGCTATASATVTQPSAALAATAAKTDVNCFGGNNGTVTVTVSGGTTAYSYLWSNGAVTQNLTGLIAGTYSVTVTDAKGCTTTASATITQPTDSLNGTTSSTPVSCVLGTDGTASVVATGGTAPYTYAWNTTPIRNTATITGLRVGSYTVTITDAKGCTIVRTVQVTGVPPLTIGSVPSPVLCNGGSTGSINLTISGGTPGYTFQWSNGANTEDITGLAAGTYSVTVTDRNGCVATASVTVQQPQPLVATATPQHIACFGANNGGVNLSVTGGTTPFTYIWSNGALTRDITGVVAGTYSVTVTDKNGCTATASATVNQQAALQVTATPTDVTCFGLNNGGITTAVNGGVAPYTYNWGGGITTANRSNLAPGTYSVTVTDANGCTGTASATITQPSAALGATIAKTDVKCFGDQTGAADLTVTGGTAPYTYAWNGGATTEDRTGLVAGTYTVTVTDAKGCTTTATTTITQPNAALNASIVKTDVNCFGDATGAANLTATGGTAPYLFTWSNQASTEDLTGLAAGTYTVTVTDANGCTATASVTIAQPSAALAATAAKTDVNCFGGSNGTITLTVTGGTTAYTFNWGGGVTTQNRTGLAAGTYSVTVTDAKGCTTTASATVAQPADSLNGVTSSTPVSCIGGTDGTASVVASGGTGPYTYVWNTTPARMTATITGLRVGSYTVTITDAKGCNIVRTVPVTGVPPLTLGSVPTPVLCTGGNTGSINLTVNGGTPGYTFQWSNGANTEDISGLTAGSYTVTVTDAKGCVATASVTVQQPQPITLSFVTVNVTTNGGSNGSIDLSVVGGTTPFTYVWSNGATTQDLSNIPAGTYCVTVTDKNGCTATDCRTITQPACTGFTASIAGVNVTCNGADNGTATVTVTGGVSPFTFNWGSGITTQNRTGLAAGSYTVTVTDAVLCTATASVTITQPATLTATAQGSNPLCNGQSNGSINLSVTGGTAPYSYSWNGGVTTQNRTGLGAGTFSVTVTDANDCIATASVTLTSPTALAITNQVTNVRCFLGADGAISTTVTGGTAPYTYRWSNNATTANITALRAGTFGLTVTDANGCTATKSLTVTQPGPLTLGSVPTPVSCFGGSDGSIDLTVTGGISPYRFAWSTGATIEDISGLAAGTYNVTVTDANNCVATVSVNVQQPAAINLTANVTDACAGGNSGAIQLNVVGGTSPFTYRWSNSATTKNIGSLAPGTYTVTVTDSKGCIATNSFNVGSNVNCRTMEFTVNVMLEGPFEQSNMKMQNKLRTQCNTVPLFQPYNSPMMGYNGTESVGSLGNDVVDWVLVSFRSGTDRNTEIYKVAGLLTTSGKVRTITGDTIFQLNSSPSDSLFVVVEHRNHMGVMTPVKMCANHASGNSVICVDFTRMQSYTTGTPATAGQKLLGTDSRGPIYGMHSGDGDCNFDINSSDFVPFGTDFNKFDIYSPGDFNMDCDCNSNDLPKWLGNFNQFSGVR